MNKPSAENLTAHYAIKQLLLSYAFRMGATSRGSLPLSYLLTAQERLANAIGYTSRLVGEGSLRE